MKPFKCPECGCEEYVNENLLGEGFKQCRSCFQDVWDDIDYNVKETVE